MRNIPTIVLLLAVALVAVGCAPAHTHVGTSGGARLHAPATGSLLPTRHRVGGMPLDIYDADALRNQGVTSAAGALREIPQSTGR